MDDATLNRNEPYGNAWIGAESDVHECLVKMLRSFRSLVLEIKVLTITKTKTRETITKTYMF